MQICAESVVLLFGVCAAVIWCMCCMFILLGSGICTKYQLSLWNLLRVGSRLDDLDKLIDSSYIQPYTINNAKVAFLKQRPQSRPFKAQEKIISIELTFHARLVNATFYPLHRCFEQKWGLVHPYGWTALRFVVDNLGVWAFHCHIEAHFYLGMGVVFEEGLEKVRELPKSVMGCGETRGNLWVSPGSTVIAETFFCNLHRCSNKHNCPFDYHAAARVAIAKANPVAKARKLDKI